jgi:hypothetical protein
MKDDYPELEGRTITINGRMDQYDTQGLVVGCCRDVGITIVSKRDNEFELICLNHKHHKGGLNGYTSYDDAFDTIVGNILKGRYESLQSGGGSISCAFR